MHLCLAKRAEWIKVLLGMETLENPRNIVLNGVPILHSEGEGNGFNVAFAKLLGLLVIVSSNYAVQSAKDKHTIDWSWLETLSCST